MEKILVVEDERVVAWDIREALEQLGYTVVGTPASAKEAIKAANEAQPDLVLMDIRLAGERDGVSAATEIYATFTIPVIFLTAHADRDTLERATASNPYGYLIKPFRAEQLHTAIQVALQRHRLESDTRTAHQQASSTLRSLGDATISVDTEGCVTMMNPVAEKLTGWTNQEALGQSVEDVLHLFDGETLTPLPNPLSTALAQNKSVKLPERCLLLDRQGMAHYIGDSTSPILSPSGEVIGAVMVFQDISERKQREDQLLRDAFHDGLTSLPNRALFLDRLGQALKIYRQRGVGLFAVLLVDLDGFRQLNEQWGQVSGDRVLVEVGQRLSQCLRSGDTVARLGGDEFGVILQNVRSLAEAELCARRLLTQSALPFTLENSQVQLTTSIGIVMGQRSYKRAEELLQDVELGAEQAKQQGGNRYHVVAG